MNRLFVRTSQILMGMFVFGVVYGLPARAADSAALYQGKCAACHAADGSGNTVVGKTLQIKDFRDPDAQKMSDSDLTTIITKGKNKMPAYETTFKPDEIKGLVAYVRELAAKK